MFQNRSYCRILIHGAKVVVRCGKLAEVHDMRCRTMLSMFGGLALLAGSAAAQDVDRGLELAQEHCSRCHDITSEGENKTYPPSFASIAVFRDRDQIRARTVFPQMHSPMPQMIYLLSNDNIDDVVAYIVSLDESGD